MRRTYESICARAVHAFIDGLHACPSHARSPLVDARYLTAGVQWTILRAVEGGASIEGWLDAVPDARSLDPCVGDEIGQATLRPVRFGGTWA